jgi:hypothetical protein
VTRAAARRSAALAVVALAVWLSLTPTPPKPGGLPAGSDLAAHLAMHCGVAFALSAAWPPSVARAAAPALALWLEAGQAQVPGRTFSLLDLGANLCGVVIGLAVWRRIGARPAA